MSHRSAFLQPFLPTILLEVCWVRMVPGWEGPSGQPPRISGYHNMLQGRTYVVRSLPHLPGCGKLLVQPFISKKEVGL